MAEFVLAALPEIEAGAEINLARVYLYAVRRQMEENITTGRTFTSLADKLYFLCELSWEMVSTDRMSLNYREFPELLKKFFGREVESQNDLDHWHYDMMGQTMLVRNDDGDYNPAHRSLLEFFVAYKLVAELGMLAPDFTAIAQMQYGLDEDVEPQIYTWMEYLKKSLAAKYEGVKIPRLLRFTPESSDYLCHTIGSRPLTENLINLMLPMIDSTNLQSLLNLIGFTGNKNLQETGWLHENIIALLPKKQLEDLDSET
jgi:hypothetical protein